MQTNQDPVSSSDFTREQIRVLITRCLDPERVPKQFKIITDTTDYFNVDYDDVVILGERPYLIRNNEREGRFGIDDQQKFWVKRAKDLTDGSTKILKLTFLERFEAKVGELRFECFRSPQKEARILDLVHGNLNFMQGHSVKDSEGNIVRVLDYIVGKTMADSILDLGGTHEDYFINHFPHVLDEFIDLVKAIKFLHDNGEKHGDIRRDHIIKDTQTGKCRWIDFDFNYIHKENLAGYDLFGLGNILVYLAARGDITLQRLKKNNSPVFYDLSENDLNIIFNNRVANLRKVFPYISDSLNFILLHFSVGANVYYETTDEFLMDLQEVRGNLP